MRLLLGRVFFVVDFFPFITLDISCQSLVTCRISPEKSADNLMGIPYIWCLLLLPFFTLYLIFVSLINMCLVLILGFMLYGNLYISWTWVTVSSPMSGNFLTVSSDILSDPFTFSSSDGTYLI